MIYDQSSAVKGIDQHQVSRTYIELVRNERVTMRLSIAQRSIAVENRSSGFDYLRIFLACGIIIWHTVPVSYGVQSAADAPHWARATQLALLPMFFSLSGFLVAGSLERSKTLVVFFGLRILRIMPALFAEVTLSALILAPMFTTSTLTEYIASPTFWAYFLNIIGDIHFELPNVFDGNPMRGMVNGQLWTIPYELECYIALGVLSLTRVLRFPLVLIMGIIVSQAVFAYHGLTGNIDASRMTVGGPMLVLSFLYGLIIYLFKDNIPYSRGIFLVASVLLIVCLNFPGTRYLSALPAAYLTVYLGLLDPPRLPVIFSGDYSYGLYLYSFPLQQAVAQYVPLRHAFLNFVIAFPLAALCAVGSWWLLEKRALKLRRFLQPRRFGTSFIKVAGHENAISSSESGAKARF